MELLEAESKNTTTTVVQLLEEEAVRKVVGGRRSRQELNADIQALEVEIAEVHVLKEEHKQRQTLTMRALQGVAATLDAIGADVKEYEGHG